MNEESHSRWITCPWCHKQFMGRSMDDILDKSREIVKESVELVDGTKLDIQEAAPYIPHI